MNIRRIASVCGLTALLSACGGGGDSGSSGFIAPTDDFNVFLAWRNLLTTSRTWNVSGVGSDGRTYDITLAIAPGATSIFPVTGTTAARSDTTVTSNVSGVGSSMGQQQIYFDGTTYAMVGIRNSSSVGSANCDVVTGAPSVPPSAVKVGSSGALATLDELNDCTNSATVGTITVTWSLEFESGTTYFCSNTTERDLSSNVLSRESDCLQVNPDGTLGAKARVTVVQSGVTLVARTP